MASRVAWLAAMVLLLPFTGWGSGCASANARSLASNVAAAKPCTSNRNATALAVSIVYAVCDDSVVLAGQSIASAAVSGCGDATAAGISVSLATLAAADLEATVSAAFAAALSSTSSMNGAAAVAQALAVAIASEPPSVFTQAEMVEAMANVVVDVGRTSGCAAAKLLALNIGQTFAVTDATGTLLPIFAAALKPADSALGTCRGLPLAAKLAPAKGWKGRFEDRVGGVGMGRVKRPIFSNGIARMRKASATAVTIAQAACPQGNATVAAIAIATASTSDKLTAATAISGVLAAGVDLTSSLTALFLDAAVTGKRSTVQALGAAIIACTPEDQAALLRIVGAAVNSVAADMGCDAAHEQLLALQSAGISTQQLQQVCFLVYSCADVCPLP